MLAAAVGLCTPPDLYLQLLMLVTGKMTCCKPNPETSLVYDLQKPFEHLLFFRTFIRVRNGFMGLVAEIFSSTNLCY